MHLSFIVHRSFVDQLFAENQEYNLGKEQFAHCFGRRTGGLLMFGSNEIDKLMRKFGISLAWSPLLGTGHGWYMTKTVGFRLDYGTGADFNYRVGGVLNHDKIHVRYTTNERAGYRGTVIDTGSSTLSMPRAPSKEIIAGILKLVHATIKKQGRSDTFEWVADRSKQYDFHLVWNGRSTFDQEGWQGFVDEVDQYFPYLVMLWRGE